MLRLSTRSTCQCLPLERSLNSQTICRSATVAAGANPDFKTLSQSADASMGRLPASLPCSSQPSSRIAGPPSGRTTCVLPVRPGSRPLAGAAATVFPSPSLASALREDGRFARSLAGWLARQGSFACPSRVTGIFSVTLVREGRYVSGDRSSILKTDLPSS